MSEPESKDPLAGSAHRKRFHAGRRSYHRAESKDAATWKDWIDGTDPASRPPTKNWPKRIGVVFIIVVLLAVAIGLVIEMWPA